MSRRRRWAALAGLAAAALVATTLVVAGATGWRPSDSGDRSWADFGAGRWPDARWRPYADDSPFNRRADDAPPHPRSAALVAGILRLGQPAPLVAGVADTPRDFGHPTFYARAGDPTFALHATQPGSAVEGMRIPIPDAARPAAGGDGHMTVVTPDGWEYDFWRVRSKPAGGGTLVFDGGGRTRIDGDGLGSFGTASLFGNLAGVIRAPELIAGRIDHALFVVLRCTSADASFGFGTRISRGPSDGSYVYPAMHGGAPCPGEDLPPLGARIRLAMSDAELAALPVPGWKRTILTALAHYGGYVGDTGGPGFAFMFESGTTYTAFGVSDPLVAFAHKQGVPFVDGAAVFELASGVDWAARLRVLTPPAG